MFSIRPFSRSLRSLPIRSLSTGAAPKPRWSETRTARNVALIASVASGIGALSVIMENRKVWNEGYGKQPTKEDPKRHEFDDDLKVNRHALAAQEGKSPDTPLNNHNSGVTTSSLPSSPASEPASVSPTIEKKADEAEEEAGSQGAYNEETGEINWDCPCLGGMAHGPCGEQFRAAFSCFVHSEQEPKGIDCVQLFKNMQDCFREHPDLYGEEIEDDEAAQAEISTLESEFAPEPKADSPSPALPKPTPPANSVIAEQTHLNNPAKGVEKLQPRSKREDVKPGQN